LSLFISLTDWRYFIPSFTELTTSDVVENKRLLAESGIDFPIGTYLYYCHVRYWTGSTVCNHGGHCVCFVYVSVSLLWCQEHWLGCVVAVCKPSVSHCNGHGGIPLQADREEVDRLISHAIRHTLSLSLSIY